MGRTGFPLKMPKLESQPDLKIKQDPRSEANFILSHDAPGLHP